MTKAEENKENNDVRKENDDIGKDSDVVHKGEGNCDGTY
jgi:hypothetical protein